MFYFWKAKAAKNRVKKYERQLDKIELKYIMQLIRATSRHGYTSIKWNKNIRKKNINALKEYGYKVTHIIHNVYEIRW
jgi:uncharacterized protein Yka (UPF0111/DUF47 family)